MLRHWPEGQEIAKRHLLICLALEIVFSLDVDTDLPPVFYCLITASSDVIAPVSCEDEVLLILLPLLLLSLHSCIIAAAVFLLFWILLLPHVEPIWRCLHLRKKKQDQIAFWSHSDSSPKHWLRWNTFSRGIASKQSQDLNARMKNFIQEMEQQVSGDPLQIRHAGCKKCLVGPIEVVGTADKG